MSLQSITPLTMTLQQLTDYFDSHPEQQEEISANVWEWWVKEKPE